MLRDYIALTKPRITWLILMSTAVGYFFGRQDEFAWLIFFHTLLGTGLIASGTAALNQWYEREADARMQRTCRRPLASGRMQPLPALIFAIALSILGFLQLWLGANLLAAVLGALTLLAYLFLYTPLKQKSWHSTTLGALPGAMPPMIGFAAARGTVTLDAWILFAILFLWQFPHFYAIAWLYREDYARAGIKMLPVIDRDLRRTVRQILYSAAALLGVSLLPSFTGMAGLIYLCAALLLGGYYLYAGIHAARAMTPRYARGVLVASVTYLPLLYGFLIGDSARFWR